MQGEQANQIGKQRRNAAYEEARQTEVAGQQEVAAASIRATRIAEKAQEYMARNRALSSKGNQSSTDASVIAIQAEVQGRSAIDQMLEVVSSQEKERQMKARARQLRYQGDIDRYSGKMDQVMGYAAAAKSVLERAEGGGFGGGGGSP